MKLQKPSMHVSKVMLCTFLRYLASKVKMQKFSKGHNSRKIGLRIFSKVNQDTHHPLSAYHFKAIASIVYLDILLTRLKCQNLQRAMTEEKKNEKF